MSEPQSQTAHLERLETEGGFTHVFRDRGNRQVVKEVIGLVRPGMGGLPVASYTRSEFEEEVVRSAQEVLNPTSGVAVPPTTFDWGVSEQGGEVGFIRMREVEGAPIEEVTVLSAEMADKIDSLVAAAFLLAKKANIHLDIYTARGTLHNIIIGKVEEAGEESPWMIDLYPLIYLRHHTDAVKNMLLGNMRQKYNYPFEKTEKALESTGVVTERLKKEWKWES